MSTGPSAPLAELLSERTTPELLYLEAKFAGLASYGTSARLLAEVLPLGRPLHAAAVRLHTQAVAQRLEDELGPEQRSFIAGCPADWEELPRPDLPIVVGIDGGYVHSCPLRQRCTTARDGRSMTIHPHEGLLRAARAQARTPEFKRAYPTRSMIERVISWTATQNGRRVKLRYTGTARNDAWLHNRCAAINLRTLLRHGLTRSGGAWVLA